MLQMSGGRVLEEEIDSELLLSKLQGQGSALEHVNLSYLGLDDAALARVAAVMRSSSAFANVKQIWLGSNRLSSLGDLPLPPCLKGLWLFSNLLNSHAALDVLLAGMQLDFTADIARGVQALQPKIVVLYPPHDKFHAMMGVGSRPWAEFAAAASAALPSAKVVIADPGFVMNAATGEVLQPRHSAKIAA